MEINKVYDATMLSRINIYQIDGCFYRFVTRTENSRGIYRYQFSPLPGQRRKVDIELSYAKLLLKVYEVPSMKGYVNSSIVPSGVQLSLFN